MAISWQWTAVMVVASAVLICTTGFVEGTTTDASCATILCLTDTVCENGECKSICASGTANCNGDFKDGCEVNVMDGDVANCGKCKRRCADPKSYEFVTCVSGQCKYFDRCALIRCAGYQNAQTTCSEGKCRFKCLPGFANCDGDLETNGCEVNLKEDVHNCGECKRNCPTPRPYSPGLAKCRRGQCE